MTARRTFIVTIRAGGPAWPVDVEYRTGDALPVIVAGSLELDRAALLASSSPRDYGQRLGEALFRGAVRDAFVRAAVRADQPLHVQLSVAAEDLRELAWETLCGPLDGQFEPLGMDQRIGFSRFIPSAADRDFTTLRWTDLRALAVIAEPHGLDDYDLPPVDAATAVAALRRGLGDVPLDLLGAMPGAIGPATLDNLCATLTARRYALLHVVAHGRRGRAGETALFLANAAGGVDRVTQTDLAARLRVLTDGLPHLVFLAACESGVEAAGAPGLARHLVSTLGLPALVAMQRRVSIATAHAFTAAFYARLQVHGHVDQAAVEALAGLAGQTDALVPAVYGRLGARPLFTVTRPRSPWIFAGLAAAAALALAIVRPWSDADDPVAAQPAIVATTPPAEPVKTTPPEVPSKPAPELPATPTQPPPPTPTPPAEATPKNPTPRRAACDARGSTCGPGVRDRVCSRLGDQPRLDITIDCEGKLRAAVKPADRDKDSEDRRRRRAALSEDPVRVEGAELPCNFASTRCGQP